MPLAAAENLKEYEVSSQFKQIIMKHLSQCTMPCTPDCCCCHTGQPAASQRPLVITPQPPSPTPHTRCLPAPGASPPPCGAPALPCRSRGPGGTRGDPSLRVTSPLQRATYMSCSAARISSLLSARMPARRRSATCGRVRARGARGGRGGRGCRGSGSRKEGHAGCCPMGRCQGQRPRNLAAS